MLKLWEIKYLMFNSQTAEQLIYQKFLHKITNLQEPSFMTKKIYLLFQGLVNSTNKLIIGVCVCVCVCERERERERERMCVWESVCVCVRERVCVCVKLPTISPWRTEHCRKAFAILKKKKFFLLILEKASCSIFSLDGFCVCVLFIYFGDCKW